MILANVEGGLNPRPRSVPGGLGLAAAVGLGLGLLFAGPTQAHGGGARLILDPPRINPGGTVVVQGDDLSADDEITLMIVSGAVRVELGSTVSDGQGHLVQAFAVPPDLEVGVYRLEAVGSGGDVIGTDLTLSGTAADPSAAQGGGQDEDDSLFVPLPSGWPGTIASPVPPAPAESLPIGLIAGTAAALVLGALVVVNVIAQRGGRA